MGAFINTVDLLGDDAVMDAIISRTITEYNDDMITTIFNRRFRSCPKLLSVNCPNVTRIHERAFGNCTSLRVVDLGSAQYIYGLTFEKCSSLTALVLRRNTVCNLVASSGFQDSLIASGSGYIFVPSALIDAYKVATNWSTYASQFRVLEDFTVDGTTTGEFTGALTVTNSLVSVTNSATATVVRPNSHYYAVLTPTASDSISSVTITMGGVNVTADVYNSETGEINIPSVTGDIVIKAICSDLDNSTRDITDGLVYGVGIGPNNPYSHTSASRVGYVNFDLDVVPGKAYRLDLITTVNTVQVAAVFYSEAAVQSVNAGSTISSSTYYDTGWFTPGTVLVAPESINGSPAKCVRFVFRKDTSNSSVTEGMITSALLCEVNPNTIVIEQGSISWEGSNGGMPTENTTSVRTDFIPFDGNATISISKSDTTYRVTLRGYDAYQAYKGSNGQWITLPGTLNWSGYPWLRLIIGRNDGATLNAADLDGAILTVDGVEYELTF